MLLSRNKNKKEREQHERETLLQCRRHCCDARHQHGEVLQDFAGNEQRIIFQRLSYNRRQNSGSLFQREVVWSGKVQLINVNSKMRKIEIIFKAKKAHLPLGENIIFSKDIDSLDLQYFMRLCRI